MSHATEKGGRVPDAEDDLLDAWTVYDRSVGVNLMGATATSDNTDGVGFQQTATWVMLMTAGDVVSVYGWQMSGSNLSADFGFASVRIA